MLDHNTLTPDVETASDAYARRFGGPVGTYFLEQQTTAVARLLSKPSAAGRRALDVGGGHGQLTSLLLQLGFDVWGQGSAPVCSRRARAIGPQSINPHDCPGRGPMVA
jgi:hypothetical protein